jgi:hypothetical protein
MSLRCLRNGILWQAGSESVVILPHPAIARAGSTWSRRVRTSPKHGGGDARGLHRKKPSGFRKNDPSRGRFLVEFDPVRDMPSPRVGAFSCAERGEPGQPRGLSPTGPARHERGAARICHRRGGSALRGSCWVRPLPRTPLARWIRIRIAATLQGIAMGAAAMPAHRRSAARADGDMSPRPSRCVDMSPHRARTRRTLRGHVTVDVLRPFQSYRCRVVDDFCQPPKRCVAVRCMQPCAP